MVDFRFERSSFSLSQLKQNVIYNVERKAYKASSILSIEKDKQLSLDFDSVVDAFAAVTGDVQ